MADERLLHDAYTANELAERLTEWLAADEVLTFTYETR